MIGILAGELDVHDEIGWVGWLGGVRDMNSTLVGWGG